MKRSSGFRPRLEPLETRFLLTVCHAVRLADLNAGHDLGNGHARGSLRYCINLANNNPGLDTIDISVTGTIQLTSNLPSLDSDMTITGPGANLLSVRAPGESSGIEGTVFTVSSGTVAMSGLTITNGYNTLGAGGITNYATLILTDCAVTNNKNLFGDTNIGGGIWNTGQMTIADCTISGNEVSGGTDNYGGGIFNYVTGVLQIENSTISGNSAEQRGSGIYNEGALDIQFSTVTDNYNSSCFSGYGLGIHNMGSLQLYNSIVAGNEGGPPGACGSDLVGAYTGSANLIGGDPMLGPLAYNGGPTQTHAVLPGSPALDAGDNTAAPEWDQRGTGYPRIVNGTVDIGAFEMQTTYAPTPYRKLALTAWAHELAILLRKPMLQAGVHEPLVADQVGDGFGVFDAPSPVRHRVHEIHLATMPKMLIGFRDRHEGFFSNPLDDNVSWNSGLDG